MDRYAPNTNEKGSSFWYVAKRRIQIKKRGAEERSWYIFYPRCARYPGALIRHLDVLKIVFIVFTVGPRSPIRRIVAKKWEKELPPKHFILVLKEASMVNSPSRFYWCQMELKIGETILEKVRSSYSSTNEVPRT